MVRSVIDEATWKKTLAGKAKETPALARRPAHREITPYWLNAYKNGDANASVFAEAPDPRNPGKARTPVSVPAGQFYGNEAAAKTPSEEIKGIKK